MEDNFDIELIIRPTPDKLSQLENDMDFPTNDQVQEEIQAESVIINARIDDEVNTLDGKIGDNKTSIDNHIADKANPHEVTKTQVGLGNCDNTADLDKPISTATQTALDGKVDKLTTKPTAGTYTKVSINAEGQVTEGSTLQASDIPSLNLTKISDVTASASEVNILDGATVTTSELNVLDGITASTEELNYVDGVTSDIQTQLNGKQATITGGATTITSSDLTTSRALVSDGNGKVAVSDVTSTELGYLDGVTSNVQDQFGNITELIPAQATTNNQLADKDFVNSSISSNTANFVGTFNSVSALEAYSGTVTNNDYAFVTNGVITDNGNDWATFNALDAYDKTLLTNVDYAWVINGSNFDLYRFDILNQLWELRVQNTQKSAVTLNSAYNRYKATVSGSTVNWGWEYTLNNSSFTAAQWAAINSLITADTKVTHTANTAIGNATTPVYVNSNGEATPISYTVSKSVPSDAEFTDTTYSFATGTADGSISVSVNGGTASDVAVKGLGSAAYTNSSAYATSAQGSKADSAVQSVSTGSANGTISVDGSDVSIYGLGSAAYTNSTAYATSTQGGKADSAIQTVKVNGSALTPDSNKAVNITVPAAQVQSDWDETDTNSKAYILNKPNIPEGVVVESALSITSENAVMNKVITEAIADISSNINLEAYLDMIISGDYSVLPYIIQSSYNGDLEDIIDGTYTGV